MTRIKEESEIFGDILQEDFQDADRNLTYKAVSWLKYLSQEDCPHVDLIVKIDDDTFVDPFKLEEAMENIKPGPGSILCQV